jgi:hypothetical protein
MGKTNLIDKVLRPFFSQYSSSIHFTSFSSDEIRKNVMDEILKSNPRKSKEEAFGLSYQKATQIFFDTL